MLQVRDFLWKKKKCYFQTYEDILYLISKKSTETMKQYSIIVQNALKNRQRKVTGELEIMPIFRAQIIIEVTTSSSVS